MVRDEKYGPAVFHILNDRRLLGCFERNVRFRQNKNIIVLQGIINDGRFPERKWNGAVQSVHLESGCPETVGEIGEGAVDDPIRCARGLGVRMVEQNLFARSVR
ncbi:hypothetical protein D1872_261370 [compost metagenome]